MSDFVHLDDEGVRRAASQSGNAHPRLADLADDQMAEAVHHQFQRARESHHIDRRGWTQEQWIEDADRLMNEPDGAITSLVNGHVMHLLAFWRAAVLRNPGSQE